MRINQRFSKFFSKFLLLFNQLFQYLKQNLINKFREKFIFQFQRIIINNDKFNTIQNLKKLIKKINQKLYFFEIVRFENFAFKKFSQIIFKTFIVKIIIRNNMFNVKKIMFVVIYIIIKVFCDKNDIDKNCYCCEIFFLKKFFFINIIY